MCGLAGFAGRGDIDDLAAMTTALAHRGPDGEGLWQEQGCPVYLGHRRLAIRDLVHGYQPMWSADGRIGVVFNGEIYNDAELRRHLESRGRVFRTRNCDTEILIHGYAEWGTALPERLNGMFAFAVFDRNAGRLLLACDRFAEKPLFYATGSGVFAFASELAALTRHRGVDRSPDPLAAQKFMAHGYVPAPLTPLKAARKLPPGGRLVYNLADGRWTEDRYWRFAIETDSDLERLGEDELAEELEGLILQAVRRRLVSDVPLGCFLSGGIDSATVLAMATRCLDGEPVRTFSLGFDLPGADETDDAERTAAAFGSRHTTIRLSPDRMAADLDRILSSPGEPIGDATLIATHDISLATRRHVTVALSGDGADELFAGYPQFAAMASARAFRRFVPGALRRGLRELTRLLPLTRGNDVVRADIERGMAALDWPEPLWHPLWLAPASPPEIGLLFGEPVKAEELYSEALDLWERSASPHALDRTLEYHAGMALPDGILVRADRGTMLASLEGRAVFLDNDIVEFCRRLPHRWKLRGGVRKYLLRRAMEKHLPTDVLTRRKRGFDLPLCRWLRALPSSAWAGAVHTGIDMKELNRRIAAHRSGKADYSLFLWASLSLARSVAGFPIEPGSLSAPQPAPLAS